MCACVCRAAISTMVRSYTYDEFDVHIHTGAWAVYESAIMPFFQVAHAEWEQALFPIEKGGCCC